ARIAPLVFETSASTDSAIRAVCGGKVSDCFWIGQHCGAIFVRAKHFLMPKRWRAECFLLSLWVIIL
ncbi:MAG: hypothetical protein NC045_08980, partial [Bacteroides sp.]|nr:hypothetical protein [Bacteroides sp.]